MMSSVVIPNSAAADVDAPWIELAKIHEVSTPLTAVVTFFNVEGTA